MDRLIYTDRKISGKSKKFKIGKKEIQLHLDTAHLMGYLRIAVVGTILGVGSFMVLFTTFGLSYGGGPFGGGFTGGLIKVYNDVVELLVEKCGIFADQLAGASESCGLFLTAMLLLLVAVSILIVIGGNRWLAFAYVLLPVIPLALWGLGGNVLSYGILALGVALFLAGGNENSNNYAGMIYVLSVALAAFLIISVPAVSHLADKPDSLAAYTEKVQKSAADSYYGENPLKNGNLRAAKREKGSGVALRVEMSQPHSMYLRGFVGDVLEEDGWTANANSVYYDRKNLMYWLDKAGFNGLGQLQQSSYLANRGGRKKTNDSYVQEVGTVTVANTGADSRYAYIPYEITGNEITTDDGKQQNWGDSFITGGWRNKLESYSYEAAGDLTSSWTETAAKYYSNNATDPQQEEYELWESHYNEYVYSSYLYISSEDRQLLDEKIGNSGIQKRGHVEYNTAVQNVKSIMAGLFTYKEKIKYKAGKSVFENIMTKYKGYDAQYATAAVMLFRYYGIPARYVEGYIITPDDVASGNSIVNVKARRNHAWAEIYVDGIGFVPVETCPKYYGIMDETDYTVGISNKTKQSTMDQSQQNTENPNSGASSYSGARERNIPSRIMLIIGIIAGLVLLVAMVLAVIMLMKKLRLVLARRKLFNKGDPKEASRAIYKRMEYLELPLDQEAIDIGNRATYSPHIVTDKERQTMLKKLKLFKEKKRAAGKPKKK